MIKCEKNECILKGNFFEIQAEFVIVIDAVRKMIAENTNEKFAGEEMKRLLEMSTWSNEKTKEETEKIKNELLKKILFGGEVDV